MKVSAWEETILIPTYDIGEPEKNPLFSEKRVYQGSSGVVYPYPVIEKIFDKREEKPWQVVYLENQFLKIMILPALGGRVQMAFDKIRNRHFIYYNQVIKPALVGLTGPWISGGIEFNWPQHHRPSTFDPLAYTIENHSDGSVTVWCSEVERMFRTKGMAGFRLYPDKAYLEVNAKLFNRTPFTQTFLWWANPAVKVNEDYQSVFPPDIRAVYDHGRRAVSEFPIAKGTYYKVDYSAGVDISRYKNIPVPTSYMAVESKYDFIAGYEHDTKGGLLHFANHHISPGKKQWTWGNDQFGYAWDRNLTDEDGPYIELMTGVFTDNQPDFSWIHPFEERTFSQYFMPYAELGLVKNATKEALVNLEVSKNVATIKLYATSQYEDARVSLVYQGVQIWAEVITISPDKIFHKAFSHSVDLLQEDLKIELCSTEGRVLVAYQPEKEIESPIPGAAEPAKDPTDIITNEQLYLTGLHIEQYRHATYNAVDYYTEGLKRDPNDWRCNNAMGRWFLRRGKAAEAQPYFESGIKTLTERNSNPYDGEAFFNLGLCLFVQEKYEPAYKAFYKATWNAAWQDVSFFYLARIEVRMSNFEEALMLIEKSLVRNSSNHTARHLKGVILRKLNDIATALVWNEASLTLDKFNYGCEFEIIAYNHNSVHHQSAQFANSDVHTIYEYAFDYAHAGLYQEAIDLLSPLTLNAAALSPMLFYYLGYFYYKKNDISKAKSYFEKAAAIKPDYCFPNRVEDVIVLQTAVSVNQSDAKALYYLGNFWYAHQQYNEAIKCWETSILLEHNFATVHRNLALAYFNKRRDAIKALSSLEKAFTLGTHDARVFMELDQLYKILNKPHAFRLNFLEQHICLTEWRDDLYLERITLYNLLWEYAKAKELLEARKFHPWEGGEGKVVSQFLICHIQLAKQALQSNLYNEAFDLLAQTDTYPLNLGEGKLYGTPENDILFLKGCALEGQGKEHEAQAFFLQATRGTSEPVQAIFYNDPQPDKIFYQGLAWKKLNNALKADAIFNKLIQFGLAHLNDKIKLDYFAVSLPDLSVFDQDLDLRNKTHCLYMIGLGHLGLEQTKKADDYFHQVLQYDVNHICRTLLASLTYTND